MNTFIKVAEVWVPNVEHNCLVLKHGIYGDCKELEEISRNARFSYQQGLPGAVWACQHPIVLNDLKNSCFERASSALDEGLSCAIGFPVMAGEFLVAIVVLVCGHDTETSGAIELWGNSLERDNELGVINGYYGTSEYFEFISRKTKIMKGFGLPGLVWSTESPVLLEDLGHSGSFIRGKDALKAGITTGLSIPSSVLGQQVYIMTFLSAKKTPLAKRMQIWQPDESRERLLCKVAHGDLEDDLFAAYESKSYSRGEDIIGRVWQHGIPEIIENPFDENTENAADIKAMLAIPVMKHGLLNSIVTFLF